MITQNPTTAYIGLGSNMGQRAQNIIQALTLLSEEPGIMVGMVSQMIETEPVGGPAGQGMYLNGAAELRCQLDPLGLAETLKSVENRLGRVRMEKWGPRTIDLDLLLFGSEIIDTPELKVPHPLMHERRFVLQPLAQIAGEAWHPVYKRTIRELLQNLRI